MFTVALFTVAKLWKQPKCPSTDEWIKIIWNIYTVEYYSTIRKEILPFTTAWIELQGITLREIRQRKRNTA